MVFTETEQSNDSDQASAIKGKQRRNPPAGRKMKSGLPAVSPTKVQDSSPSKTGSKNSHITDICKTIFPTVSIECGLGNHLPCQPAGAHDESRVEAANHDAKTMPSDIKNNNGECSDPVKSSTEEVIKENTEDMEILPNQSSEIARLKKLLLLQVSLISRQQDLLRLRDREIMQLKASNSNYKCQLTRVRRRMSKRKSDGQEESPKSSKRKSPESSKENSHQSLKEVSVMDSQTQTPSSMPSSKDDTKPKPKKRRLEYSDDSKDDSCGNLSPGLSSDTTNYDSPGPSKLFSTPDKQNCSIPVPLAFIEQKQNELFQAMMISPPDKAVKTFCDITNSSPHLDEFPFKICDRCPHCVAIAQEITRLFKAAENSKSPDISKSKEEEKEIFGIAGVTSTGEVKDGKKPILRTSVSYHRTFPTFDQNHWWWDLQCSSIKSDQSLNIPTWKIHDISSVDVEEEESVIEETDDQAYMRRHYKLEIDEKRRKRWDIQRIREFRYNERLRQKLMKQGTTYDYPSLESFYGQLHDAEHIEVSEDLPVNVFGHPVPHLELEEFTLSNMRESKGSHHSTSRKKTKK